MTDPLTNLDKRREGLVILIEAAPGQGIGDISRSIEAGDTVRLFVNRRPILAEVTGLSRGSYSGCVTSDDEHIPVHQGQQVLFEEINVDAVFKRKSAE